MTQGLGVNYGSSEMVPESVVMGLERPIKMYTFYTAHRKVQFHFASPSPLSPPPPNWRKTGFN